MKYLKIITVFLILAFAKKTIAQQITSLTNEKREFYIQNALQFRKIENYSAAIKQLDTILVHNPTDASILLFKGDLLLQNKNFSDAATTYKKLLPLKFETTITKINLSYALFMNHKPSNALQFAKAAWTENKPNVNATVNYFNAMLWNVKTTEATLFLQQQKHLLSPAQILVLKARLFSTSGNYNNGLQYYDSLVKSYPDKYYVQEFAEVLLGKKEVELSKKIMKENEKLFSANDLKIFDQKIKDSKMQQVGTEMVYFKDLAKNIRIENTIFWQQGDLRKYRFGVRAGVTTLTSAINEKTTTNLLAFSIKERWSKSLSGNTDINYQRIIPSNASSFDGITGQQTIQYQPNDRRMISALYSTDILSYTASLLQKKVRSNNVGYITHLMMDGHNGFYSQGTFGSLNDNNKRLLFFGSLYHLFRTEPTIKSGINFSALHFADSSIKNYFSPNKYLSTEIFADYSTALANQSKYYLQTQAAVGAQKIESQKWQSAYRFQAEIGMRTHRMESSLKYQTSNTAGLVGTGAGYKFNWFTFRIAYKW